MDQLLNVVVLGAAVVLLLACEWLGFRRWVRPLGERATREVRLAVFILVLTLAGGFIGAFSWWFDVPGSFAWDVPPLGSRMLGSAGWAFALASWAALERPTLGRLRLVMTMLVVYLAPLAVALILLHLDRLDFGAPITYPFFAVVILLIVAPAFLLTRLPTIEPDAEVDGQPPRPATRAWLMAVAILSLAWSLALFVTDNGPIAAVWAWPGDALTSRLIAAMLLTIAVASAMSLRSRDLAGLTSAITLVYGLGLAVASFWLLTAGKPINAAYVLVFGGIAVGSLGAWLAERRRRPPAGAIGTEADSQAAQL